MAIVYDFDGTLCLGYRQEHQFISEIGMSKAAFWERVGHIAKKMGVDETLVYKAVPVTKHDFLRKGRGSPLPRDSGLV